jgi:hypothetical protein
MKRKTNTNFLASVKMHTIADEDTHQRCSYVFFTNEYAYVTNGKVLIKNYLEEISNFDKEQRELLNGKTLILGSYKNILRYKHVEILEEGISAKDGNVHSFLKFSDCNMYVSKLDELLSQYFRYIINKIKKPQRNILNL